MNSILALVYVYLLFVCYCVYNKLLKRIAPSGIHKVMHKYIVL